MSAWSEWGGNDTGAPPPGVTPNTRVDLRLRDNALLQSRPAGEVLWLHLGCESDIVAYRQHSQLMRFCLACGALDEADGARGRPVCCAHGPGAVVQAELGRLARLGWAHCLGSG